MPREPVPIALERQAWSPRPRTTPAGTIEVGRPTH